MVGVGVSVSVGVIDGIEVAVATVGDGVLLGVADGAMSHVNRPLEVREANSKSNMKRMPTSTRG